MTTLTTDVHAPFILLVDDNPDDQDLAARALQGALPHAVLQGVQDADGLRAALQGGGFDLVVTDYYLGFTTGLEVLQSVKARFADIPVILFTLTGSEEIAVEAMKSGADDYVLKTPKRLPLLVNAVTRALARAGERREFREAESRYRDLFDRVPVGLFHVGVGGTLLNVNPTLARLLGESDPADVQGRNVGEFVPDQRETRALARALERGEHIDGAQLTLRRAGPGGAHVTVELNARPQFGPEGLVIGAQGSVQDVTARLNAERQLQEANATLERRVKERTSELEDLNRELEAFSYSVSHDLRAPLRHIEGFARLLEREAGALSERGQNHLARIAEASARMTSLIDGLLDFARVGRTQLQFSRVDLAQLVATVRSDLAPEEAGRTVEWEVGELPGVLGDALALRQVFENLLSNALKYTRPREVARINVSAQTHNGGVRVEVRDNGVGFDARFSDKLFGVFQRLHLPQDFEGTGVGLASVRRIVERHGGTVEAHGRLGEGATFAFTLPTRRDPRE